MLKVKQVVAAAVAGVSLLGLGFWFGSVSASTTEPGSAADPLVSRSYVEQVIQGLIDNGHLELRLLPLATKDELAQAFSQVLTKDELAQGLSQVLTKNELAEALVEVPTKAQVESVTQFRRVDVPQGFALLGEAGTEIVLRGGKATAIVSNMGGVLDATAGVDLVADQAIVPNHLLVIPISDGRGISATTDVILIVKGSYAVQPILR